MNFALTFFVLLFSITTTASRLIGIHEEAKPSGNGTTILQFQSSQHDVKMWGNERIEDAGKQDIKMKMDTIHNFASTESGTDRVVKNEKALEMSIGKGANEKDVYTNNIEASDKSNSNGLHNLRSAYDCARGAIPRIKDDQAYFLQDLYDSESSDPDVCKTPLTITHLEPRLSNGLLSHKRDMFNCSVKCMCKYLDKETHIEADCAMKHLTSIPLDLPKHIIKLDISHNRIADLNLWVVFMYGNLIELHAIDCYIQNISNWFKGSISSLQTLDLRYNHIQTLNGSIFVGFTYLEVLLLTGNKIYHIKEDFFLGLDNLKFLDLSINNILSISVSSFKGLTKLEKLSLSGNRNLGYKVLSYDLFKDLKRLRALKIQGCSNGSKEYPNQAMSALPNLEDLNIDALAQPAEFQPIFSRLKRLRVLRFGPYADCHLTNMSVSFFQYFSNIKCLYFHSCNLTINYKAYGSFKNLLGLAIDNVPSMTIDEAFKHLLGFKIKSLKHIGFRHLTNWNWPCIWLTSAQGKYMIGFNLTSIDLSENRLSLLSDSFIKTIPKTVDKLILRDNKFTLINIFWTTLVNMTNLTYVDVSAQNMESQRQYFPLGSIREFPPLVSKMKEEKATSKVISYGDHSLEGEYISHGGQHYGENSVLHIPENLQIVKASMYHLFGSILLSNTIGNNSLRSLNFSHSGLNDWGCGRLPKNVEILDLSVNAATYIRQGFFPPDNTLIQLHIGVNFLGDFIGRSNSTVLRNLANLRYIDLSTNVIFDIPFDFFDGLKRVETIVLTDNRIETLNVSFENTPHLSFLDLHKNSLSWISKTTRNQLDNIQGLVIDLHYNSFVCDCDTIEIIKWMSMTSVYLLNIHLYQCYDQHNRLVGLGSREAMKIRVEYLQRVCSSYGYMIFGSIAFAFIFLISAAAGIAYRNRWWIRYKKHILFAKWYGFKPNDGRATCNGPYFKYDAYLLYVNADRQFAIKCSNELEKKRKHSLCIGDREILPGTNELAAIVSAIQNSRFTLVVITDNFVTEMENQFRGAPMMEHAIQMALMEVYCTKRKLLHVMLCSSHDGIKYPPYILKILRDRCVTWFPSVDEQGITEDMINTFWDDLSSTIGHTEQCVLTGCHDNADRSWFNNYSLGDIN